MFGSPVHMLPMSTSSLQWHGQRASCDQSGVGDIGRTPPAAVRGPVGPPVGTRWHATPSCHHRLEPYDHPAWPRRTRPGPASSSWESAPPRRGPQTRRKEPPGVPTALEEVLQDDTAGDPIRGVKWTRKTPAKLSRPLRRQGLRGGRTPIRRVLRKCGYTLRANRERLSRRQNPNRDRQVRSIARQRRRFLQAGWPVIRADTKKKEWVGNFRNAGQTWRRAPWEVLATDFPSDADGKALP
jgi:Rhodopirellula transposase DDE domain